MHSHVCPTGRVLARSSQNARLLITNRAATVNGCYTDTPILECKDSQGSLSTQPS